MPITSIGSYGPTMQEFETNWTQANSELGAPPDPTPITLAGGYTLGQFQIDKPAVLTSIEEVHIYLEQARTAATGRDGAKLALIERGKQFRNSVLAQITDKSYTQNLPTLPNTGHDLSKFSEPLDAMRRLWERINQNAMQLGLSGDLTLQGGYTQAQFGGGITQIAAYYNDAERAEENAGFARTKRDNSTSAIYERMKQYRAAAPAMLPANSPALMNLPRLSPIPGTTPPGLEVTGEWNSTQNQAYFSWPASTFHDLDKLQVRGCTGSTYKAADEEVVADLLPTATSYATDWGLTAPGALAVYKVYVMATTGNENGGKAVKIVRPVT